MGSHGQLTTSRHVVQQVGHAVARAQELVFHSNKDALTSLARFADISSVGSNPKHNHDMNFSQPLLTSFSQYDPPNTRYEAQSNALQGVPGERFFEALFRARRKLEHFNPLITQAEQHREVRFKAAEVARLSSCNNRERFFQQKEGLFKVKFDAINFAHSESVSKVQRSHAIGEN